MSVYTAQLKTICESFAGLTSPAGYDEIDNVINLARPKIFRFNYPIFDIDYKPVLETKIIKHYFTREICWDTVGRWLLELDSRFNVIMPYYNKLYESELIKFNPMFDTDLYRTYNRKRDEKRDINENRDGESNTNTTSNSESYNLFNNTPQGGLDGIDSMKYLTTATKDTANNSSNATSNYTGTVLNNQTLNNLEDYIEHVSGKNGTENYSDMLNKFRSTFLNIDADIIGELSDLFFGIY